MTAPTNKPLSLEWVQRFKDYNHRNHGWKSLHLVLENLNVKDVHVGYCKQRAMEDLDWEGHELCIALQGLSESQRIKLARSIE